MIRNLRFVGNEGAITNFCVDSSETWAKCNQKMPLVSHLVGL